MSRILVAGLNPAWQKIMEFADFHPGEVNRARTLVATASGKGTNAAKVLRGLGHEVFLLQILGGGNGRRCLEVCDTLGINSLHAWVSTETRGCTTLVEGDNRATEIIEPFAVDAPDLEARLLSLLPESADAFDGLVVSGSIPAGAPPHLYDALLRRFSPKVTIWDAVLEMTPETVGKVTCIKVNRKEYAAMHPRVRALGPRIPLFMVTDGGGEASIPGEGGDAHRFAIPKLRDARNPIGAGDTVTAGLAHFLLEGLDAAESFRRGLAMGSASCLSLAPADFSPAAYAELLPQVKRIGNA